MLSTITIIGLLALLLFLDAIRTKMDSRTTSKVIKIKKRKKNKDNELSNKNPKAKVRNLRKYGKYQAITQVTTENNLLRTMDQRINSKQ